MKRSQKKLFCTLIVLALLGILIFLLIRKSSKECFYLEELKDQMVATVGYKGSVLLNGNNVLINLDQAFGFFAGLNNDTRNPLLTSGCLLQQYNDKDLLIFAANFLYQYHTENIPEDTMKSNFTNVGLDYAQFMGYMKQCRETCDKSELNIFKITEVDFLLGFIIGTLIKQAKGEKIPCINLINAMRRFMWDCSMERLMLYVNTVMIANGGEITKEEGEEILKRNHIDKEQIKSKMRSYCDEYCGKQGCLS
jgi:hypothetical protein